MKYYLGIDGGGTRTVAAVSDEQGCILLRQEGKTINFYSVGMSEARKNLAAVLAEIDAVLGITEFAAAFNGCSALDGEADDELTEKLCSGIINAEKIRMNSDAYIALKAVGECECPCAAICGTGSMAIAQDKRGNIRIAGGWGHTIGDEGSAYAVAIRALKLCCHICDKDEVSPLLECAESFFGVNNLRNAIDIIYSPDTTKDILASFAETVGDLALSGDTDALKVICTEAELFADTVLTLLDKIEYCTVLGLYGGVFEHNDIFICTFSEKIKKQYPNLAIKLLNIPPADSASELARKL